MTSIEDAYIDPFRLDPMLEFLGNGRSESILREWARRMKYFRLTVPTSRRDVQGDILACRIRYDDDSDMLRVAHGLGLAPYGLAAERDNPLRGDIYVGDRGNVMFEFGTARAHFLGSNQISLRISGNAGNIYVVTEEDVRVAEMLEAKIARFASQVIDPPLDYKHCFCPKYYPEFFEPPSTAEATPSPSLG